MSSLPQEKKPRKRAAPRARKALESGHVDMPAMGLPDEDTRSPRQRLEDARALTGALAAAALSEEEDSDPEPLAFFTADDFWNIPPVEPLLDGWLNLRASAMLVGKWQSNKTFLLLDWGCCVITGTPWLGHKVLVQSPVIYALGEGKNGFPPRVRAWEKHNGKRVPIGPDGLQVGKRLPSLLSKNGKTTRANPRVWESLRDEAERTGARLIILDTLSSLAPEVNELSDIPIITKAMSDLAEDIDGCVIMAHHTGWAENGDDYKSTRGRGSSAQEANVDEVITLTANDSSDNPPVTLHRKKVKDGPAGATFTVRRKVTGGSCVLVEEEPVSAAAWSVTVESRMETQILDYCRETGRSKRDIIKGTAVKGKQDKKKTFVELLISTGKLRLVGGERYPHYRTADDGTRSES